MTDPTLAERISEHLPGLRRYARALTGSQRSGDAYVAALLEAVIVDPSMVDAEAGVRIGLFTAFHRLWSADAAGPREPALAEGDEDGLEDLSREQAVQARLERLPPASRQALLLYALEGFASEQVAAIMGGDAETAERLIAEGLADLRSQMRANVLIIEDEPIIAMDIEAMVTELGHSVSICDTHAEAVELAKRDNPDIVLADIQLADGSSGLEAVREILTTMKMPIVFVTAYPERLLTARAPEPAFLVAKPFKAETLQAAVSQALFFREAAALG